MPRPPPLSAAEVARERKMLRELKEMRKRDLTLSTLSKKRLRVPKADDDNPFCSDRQADDEASLHEFNRNPQLHVRPKFLMSPRALRENPHNHTDMRGTPILPHVRVVVVDGTATTSTDTTTDSPAYSFKFPAYHGAIAVERKHISTIKMLQRRSYSSPSGEDTSGATKKPVTFGHRPKSASRHFNPVTSELNASAQTLPRRLETKALAQAGGVAIGMSAERLKALLHPPRGAVSVPAADATAEAWVEKDHDDEAEMEAKKALEKGFDTRQYASPKPHMESILNTPTDASVGDILAKYRKLAVGLN
ncbi:Aste57867_17374 [Aphanomyces stellatus]|uniref:Aste57867_17374 protein n=1 Tax=Aphanomyces stellatus TaxID=120398 RepID=A0A485L9E9_9STRA|nr:hypothetical protein As57867_017314 [Aphanomyces stellatus]VFT94130.1 Aste57867_17374 [Aphanomyces stellatus]